MNNKKLNIFIGFISFMIVYAAGILLFHVLSYGGYFFIEKNPNMMRLYTFFVGVTILLYIALWIKTNKKLIIIINTGIAFAMLLLTPAIANTYFTASEEIRILFHSNHKNEIQAIEKIIKDQQMPYSLYKRESLKKSKYYDYLSIAVVKTSHSELTSEDIQSFIDKMPKRKMSISFSNSISGDLVIIEIDENKSITNCFPENLAACFESIKDFPLSN